MKRFFKILIWVIVAAVFVGTFVFLYKNSQPKEVTYQIVTPEIGSIERTTVLTGKIEPRDQIDIKPQISGIISEILVEAGQNVKAGDVIARIKVIPDASQLSSAQNRVEQAKIALTDASDKYERAKTLYERKLISREEYETAQATFDRSK
ncbi:MAG: biotin/lipoyl-binding protein, partial [Muribaculaceae bacterium]|nr:biotin/lipoyl-binding protein [Muribaculaceae bacterium]